jgi:hypothetical protein
MLDICNILSQDVGYIGKEQRKKLEITETMSEITKGMLELIEMDVRNYAG